MVILQNHRALLSVSSKNGIINAKQSTKNAFFDITESREKATSHDFLAKCPSHSYTHTMTIDVSEWLMHKLVHDANQINEPHYIVETNERTNGKSSAGKNIVRRSSFGLVFYETSLRRSSLFSVRKNKYRRTAKCTSDRQQKHSTTKYAETRIQSQ